MQLFVRGQNVHTIDANVSASVAWLKAVAAQREGLLVEDVVLYNAGRPMVEESSLVDVASDLDTIDMCVKILGGKVHGSLARAGKVKGQTPKVEKDKEERVKKKKTGRAKRRMQYNRRYVNVVAGFGRKKGPNSQET